MITVHGSPFTATFPLCFTSDTFSWVQGCYGDRITATPAVTSHDSSEIPRDRLVTEIVFLQALMLQTC